LVRHLVKLAIMALAAGGLSFPPDDAFAQAANELVGSWTLVSITVKQGDRKFEPFGSNPKGILIFDRSGVFSIIVSRSNLPKFQSNNRGAGTPEEEEAVVRGSIAYFGTYTVNEEDRAFIVHIEGSTFPNWVRTDQKRIFTITADELRYTNSNRSGGAGVALVVWKRVK
jgi:Lipocalin-like domain